MYSWALQQKLHANYPTICKGCLLLFGTTDASVLIYCGLLVLFFNFPEAKGESVCQFQYKIAVSIPMFLGGVGGGGMSLVYLIKNISFLKMENIVIKIKAN